MKTYDKDTSAHAVVLDEFGDAYFDNYGDHNLIFEHHFKVKVLKTSGLNLADYEIPLRKHNGRSEILRSIEASSFNLENGTVKESKVDLKKIYTEKRNDYIDIKKIPVPNVQVGSVFEIKYVLESPFIFNFRTWTFQWDIPKVRSEFWALIPANYNYNVILKGFLPLSKNESELVKDWFSPGGGNKADCSRLKLAMTDIPAFLEEDFMTASHNYISSINFELSEIKYFDGRVDKITAEWKDVEDELRREQRFGVQLKRGKDLGDAVGLLVASEKDSLARARKVYDFVKSWFKWNEEYSKYCENGIKKAFDSKTGNVGDINLSLIAALRFADLDADPMILSTRENGFVTEIHPVLSDFNYVIAKLNIGTKSYLLDATDPFMPFGTIPLRCLNGKGRVIGDKNSYWYDLTPSDKMREVNYVTLRLDPDGYFRGTVQRLCYGYDAISRRKKIFSFSNRSEYIQDLDNELAKINIKNFEVEDLEDIQKPLTEKFDVEIEGFDDLNKDVLFFNPYFIDRWEQNPFRSNERLYPVDFAAPVESFVMLTLEYPEEFQLESLPENVALVLPDSGGRFYVSSSNLGNKLTISNRLTIARTLYTSNEYHLLKELFSRILQIQNTDIVLKKKVKK